MPATILIPAFNEATTISQVIQGLRTKRPDDEILVIDDGSSDGTGILADEAGARVIVHDRNQGYGGALKTGIRHARYENLVFFDGDGQHDPSQIEPLLEKLQNYDMVVGARPKGKGDLGRRTGKWLLQRVANYLVGFSIPDLNSGLRALRKNRIKPFIHLLPDGFSLTTTITLALLRSGFLVAYIPISYIPRTGNSTVSPKDFFKTLILIGRMIILFAPLKIFMPLTALLALATLPILIHDLLQKNIGDTVVLLGSTTLIIFVFGLLADAISLVSRKDFTNLTDDFTEKNENS